MIRDFFIAGFIIGLMVIAIAAFCMFMDSTACHASWRDSGMPVRWGAFSGCQVSPSPNVWLPTDAYTSMNKNLKMN